MSQVIIGTSGYSYDDWIGPFYPAGTSRDAFLDFYAKEFNMVELNFSYYKQPASPMIKSMSNHTSEDFLFCIKAHKSMTHEIDDKVDQNIIIFKEGIQPLTASKKLGAVLFQFPFSFHYTTGNRKYLDRLFAQFISCPVVVEFRNSEWQNENVLNGLKERHIGVCNVDEPDLDQLLKADHAVTSEIGYIRFHGRNKKNWWSGDNTSRYDYLYNESQLIEWIPRVLEIMKSAKILLVAFNNHYKAQAVENARQFKTLLLNQNIQVL